MLKKNSKILLVDLGGIGDTCLSVPAIRNLRSCFPQAFIGILTLPGPEQIMKRCPYLDQAYVISPGAKYFMRNLNVLSTLRNEKFDAAVNLHQLYLWSGAFKMALLFAFINSKESVGRDTDGKGFFYGIKVPDSILSSRHDVEYKLEIVRALGCVVKDSRLEVWFDRIDEEFVDAMLAQEGVRSGQMVIGINPNARRPSHRWPRDNFSQLAAQLSKKYGAKIICTGSASDIRETDKACRQAECVNISGRLTITQLAALMKRCRVFVSNDTAPMHIANASGAPLVAIMGPGTLRTAPYQRENCVILSKDLDCSPCYRFTCRDMRCLKEISVEEVVEAVGLLLSKSDEKD